MGKAKVITKAIEKLTKGKKEKKMRYSATKAEEQNAIAELKRNYGGRFEPTKAEIRHEVEIQRIEKSKTPVKKAKELIEGKRKIESKAEKEMGKQIRKKKSQRQAMLDDEIKKVAEDEGISLKKAREIVEANVNEYLGNYDRGGDVVQPNKPLQGAARKLAKGLQGKASNFKPRTAQQRFLTGFASGVFKLTPADRYMKTYGKQPRAKTRKDK